MAPDTTWITLRCRECGITEITLPLEDGEPNPGGFTCRACNDGRSILDGMSAAEIAEMPLARLAAKERAREREGHQAYDRRIARERKFKQRNGFTTEEWHRRVDALGWVCALCGCALTKEPRKDNSVVQWSTDGSKSLDKMVPVCRPCQCKKIAPLGAPI